MGEQGLEHFGLMGELLVAALRGLFALVYAALHELHVRHDELEVDDVDVPGGVGAALDVDYVLVVEAPDDMDYGVRAAYVLEELVAQALAVARALYETGYVDELNDGGGVLLGRVQVAQEVQALVRYGDDADVWLYGAEGVVCALRARVGYRVEQCALADVGQADDAEFHVSYLLSFQSGR